MRLKEYLRHLNLCGLVENLRLQLTLWRLKLPKSLQTMTQTTRTATCYPKAQSDQNSLSPNRIKKQARSHRLISKPYRYTKVRQVKSQLKAIKFSILYQLKRDQCRSQRPNKILTDLLGLLRRMHLHPNPHLKSD